MAGDDAPAPVRLLRDQPGPAGLRTDMPEQALRIAYGESIEQITESDRQLRAAQCRSC